jgi:hypothetical protein
MSQPDRELSTHVIDEAWSRGETLLIDDLIKLVARHDDDGHDGVRVDRLVAYAKHLHEDGHPVDPERIRPAIEERVVDDAEWVGQDTLYRLGVDENESRARTHEERGDGDGSEVSPEEDDAREADAEAAQESEEAKGTTDGDGAETESDTEDAAEDPPESESHEPDAVSDDEEEEAEPADANDEEKERSEEPPESEADDEAEPADDGSERPTLGPEVDVDGEDRVSVCPESWYDELSGERDITRYIEVITSKLAHNDTEFDRGGAGDVGAGDGIPENVLLDIVGVIGGVDRDDARSEIERLRDEGVLAEDADQHPNANVRLADGAS